MFEVLQERILRHRKYYGKRPSKLAVTPEQRAALFDEIKKYTWGINENPLEAPKEELFMGIPLEVIDIVEVEKELGG